ncbi:unnamed protein product, partial [Oppiella nova]
MTSRNGINSGGKGCRAKALIAVANQSDDPLLEVNQSVRTFVDHNGREHRLSCHRWDELDAETQQWIQDVTEHNMKSFYESSSCGWNRSQKEKELRHSTARHLVVRSQEDNRLVAFSHFRFETGGQESECCVYCYELQVEASHQ